MPTILCGIVCRVETFDATVLYCTALHCTALHTSVQAFGKLLSLVLADHSSTFACSRYAKECAMPVEIKAALSSTSQNSSRGFDERLNSQRMLRKY